MVSPAFTELPTEILEAIFLHLDHRSLVFVSQTNKFVQGLTIDSPLIWRHLCLTKFRQWDARHNIALKFAGPLSDVDWRQIYISRVKNEETAKSLLSQIIDKQQGRIRNINVISEFGVDVKEVLLMEVACSDDARDVLARRYYANAVLGRIHRETAIRTWKTLSNNRDDVPIERALGAYDVFARLGDEVDLDVITEDVDRLGAGLLAKHTNFHDLNTLQKASTLATYLRDEGFRGVSDQAYRALCNSFIGLALTSLTHESLPLISVAIYCAVAQRVGLDARPCGFLFHMYTIIYAPKNYSLEGKYTPHAASVLEATYMDPFRSSEEVKQIDLIRTLRDLGVPGSDQRTFLGATTTQELVLRTARNIMNSVQTIRQSEAARRNVQPTWLSTTPDMDNAFYASIWAMIICTTDAGHQHTGVRRRQYLPYLLEHFQTHFPWDVGMLEEHVIPMFAGTTEAESLLEFVQQMHQVDQMPKEPMYRDGSSVNVTYKVGQLFQHRRYGYEGIITGWDTNCDAGEEWIQNMRVDQLANGRDQAFYHVLVYDKSVRYVAEENILPAPHEREPSEAIIQLAGRHFKRWDSENRVFVSNVKDEYPDN